MPKKYDRCLKKVRKKLKKKKITNYNEYQVCSKLLLKKKKGR